MSRRLVFLSALLLSIVSLLHLMRVFFPIPITIGTLHIPIALSVVVFVVSGTLSAYLFRALRNLNPK